MFDYLLQQLYLEDDHGHGRVLEQYEDPMPAVVLIMQHILGHHMVVPQLKYLDLLCVILTFLLINHVLLTEQYVIQRQDDDNEVWFM